MKSSHSLAKSVITFCLLLFPVLLLAHSKPAYPEQNYAEPEALSEIIKVAVAKEPIYLILVEKNLQRLQILEYGEDLKIIADFPAATGENSGVKEVRGDSKTPEGIYFVTRVFKDDKVTIFGDRAFHLDYPNFFDRTRGRNGDGIYIHGTNKILQPNSTNGCVTLAKNDLDQLENYLNQMVTPVIIVSNINSIKANTQLLTENDFRLVKSLLLLEGIQPEKVEYSYLYLISSGKQTVAVSDFIYRPYRRSIMHGASKVYLQYDPAQGWVVGKRIWQASPLQIYPENTAKLAARPFVTDEITIAEHNQQDTVAPVATLNSPVLPEKNITPEKAQNPEPQVAAKPAQHELKKSQDIKPSIMTINKTTDAEEPDIRMAVTPSPRKEIENKVAHKVAIQAPVISFDIQQILDFVETWRKAWVSQKIDPYIAFYDESFRSGDRNLAEWKKFKEIINKSYSYITVDISDIKIHRTADGVRVSFRQKYLSDHYKSTGNKILYLVHDGSGWKIKHEFFSNS